MIPLTSLLTVKSIMLFSYIIDICCPFVNADPVN